MSRLARALVLGATLAAMCLAGMPTVARAQAKDPPASTQDARQPPTERQVGESWRQRPIDRQAAAGQADEQPTAGADSQHTGAQFPRRFIRPERPVDTSPRLDNDQLTPVPAPIAPDHSSQVGLAIALGIAALLLALGAATSWRIHRRRPRPEPTT
jgi:hypothetical protein